MKILSLVCAFGAVAIAFTFIASAHVIEPEEVLPMLSGVIASGFLGIVFAILAEKEK